MNQLAATLLTMALLSPTALGADTFASKLRDAKHIGLTIDPGLSAFTVYIYTPEQFKTHVASLEDFRRERAAFDKRMQGYERERAEARERLGALGSRDASNVITRRRNLDAINPPASPFEARIKLSKVVSVGDDYFAIAPVGEPGSIVLIPFSRVGRAVTVTDARTAQTEAEAE